MLLPTASSNLAISHLAIGGHDDIVYGGVDLATSSYVLGALSGDGSVERFQTVIPSRTAGVFAVRADGTIRLWLGSASSSPVPSALVDLTDDGLQTATQDVLALPTPGGIVIDAAGTTYLAGRDYAARRPAILRR